MAEEFKPQDHIEVKNPDTEELVLGKINKIEGGIAYFNIYKRPEEVNGGR